MTFVHGHGGKVCYQFATDWGEVGNNTLVVVNIDVHTEQKFSLITANQLNY